MTAIGGALGSQESLSTWAGPYVTDMLGKGKAVSEQPYQAYGGPLTAGANTLQTNAFQGLGNLAVPTAENQPNFTPSSFTGMNTGTLNADGSQQTTAEQYMSPYVGASLEPQIAEAQRQAEKQRLSNGSRMTAAGAFGGSRQALMDSETQRNLTRTMADITGRGYDKAYDTAQQQFNTEQDRSMLNLGTERQYGLAALQAQLQGGAAQRGIESEGIAADYDQFEMERDQPYKNIQFQQSLLDGLPIGTSNYAYQQPSSLDNFLGGAAGGLSIFDQIMGVINSGDGG